MELGVYTVLWSALCLGNHATTDGCFLSACSWLCSFTSCRSVLSRSGCSFLPAVGPLFSFLGSGVFSLAVFLFSPIMPALSCARHPAGTAHVGEALFQGLPGLLLARRQDLTVLPPLQSCSMALLCRRGPKRFVVSGHLSTNSALLIDRSSEPVEPSLPSSCRTLRLRSL